MLMITKLSVFSPKEKESCSRIFNKVKVSTSTQKSNHCNSVTHHAYFKQADDKTSVHYRNKTFVDRRAVVTLFRRKDFPVCGKAYQAIYVDKYHSVQEYPEE